MAVVKISKLLFFYMSNYVNYKLESNTFNILAFDIGHFEELL